MTIAAGIDVGTGAVKAAIFKIESGKETGLARALLRIRQRDPIELARVAFDQALEDAKLHAD
ncbi:MAG: benzoyl-CoA reductase subunit D, partial [Pseudorhodoplanes sp.]|nr:benzoyl-CoA reductase subunit D [Pseudorhodoplanes sp.]